MGRLPLFEDRVDAGRLLAAELRRRYPWVADAVVLGLARGGVEVAAEVAKALDAPLDVIAVRKVGHPFAPEYAIGAVTPGGVYLRGPEGLTRTQVEEAVARAEEEAAALDRRLQRGRAALDLRGAFAFVVDDGLATGATMVAALRWTRSRGAAHVVAAVPVAAASSVAAIRVDADDAVCLYELEDFAAVGFWYREFRQVSDEDMEALLLEAVRDLEPVAR